MNGAPDLTRAAGELPRAGRWAGTAKTECGIHRSLQTTHAGSPPA